MRAARRAVRGDALLERLESRQQALLRRVALDLLGDGEGFVEFADRHFWNRVSAPIEPARKLGKQARRHRARPRADMTAMQSNPAAAIMLQCEGRLRARRFEMQDALADGGLIRKLWVGEADRYRDHLLRLDRDSRHSRFGGGVADVFIHHYAQRTFALCAAVHGYFVDGVLRGAAELRPLG